MHLRGPHPVCASLKSSCQLVVSGQSSAAIALTGRKQGALAPCSKTRKRGKSLSCK